MLLSTYQRSLKIGDSIHDLVNLGVLETVSAGETALHGEEPGDGDGLAEGGPLVLQHWHLSIRQRGLQTRKLTFVVIVLTLSRVVINILTEVYPLIFVLLASVGQNQPGGLCPASCAEISQFNVAHLGSNLQYRAWLSQRLYLHSQKSGVTGYVRNIGDRVHPLITVLDTGHAVHT